MNSKTKSLESVFDSAFASIRQARQAFAPRLAPLEVGTITSIATGIAKVSGLPGVGFDEVLRFSAEDRETIVECARQSLARFQRKPKRESAE